MSGWYLVHTKIRQELVAVENLERQGFDTFLPMLNAEKLRRGKLVVVREPLFPRYLFIRLSTGIEAQSWGPIRSTVGVSRLVTFGHSPARLDDEIFIAIRSRSESQEVMVRQFSPNDHVVLTQGPFVGVDAIYQTSDAYGRVILLLNLLNKQVKLTTEAAFIESK